MEKHIYDAMTNSAPSEQWQGLKLSALSCISFLDVYEVALITRDIKYFD